MCTDNTNKPLKYIINGITYFSNNVSQAKLKETMKAHHELTDMVSVVRPEDDEEIDLLTLEDLFNLPNREL